MKEIISKKYLQWNWRLAFLIFIVQPFFLHAQTGVPVHILNQLSVLKLENRLDSAIGILDKYIESPDCQRDQKKFFEARTLKADYYRMNGQNTKAQALIDSLTVSFPEICTSNDPLAGKYYVIQGTLKLVGGELEEGRQAIAKAQEIFRLKYGDDDTLLCPCYNKLGNYYYFTKQFDSAMYCYSRALELNEKKTDCMEDQASYLQNKAIVYLEQKDIGNAEFHFLKSLKIKESILAKNSYSLGRLYLNLSRFYHEVSAFDKALFYIERAEIIFNKTGSDLPFELGVVYWNKGLVHLLMEETDAAITYLHSAKQIIDSVFSDRQQLLASLNADLGYAYSKKGKIDKAIMYYNAALENADPQLKTKIFRGLAFYNTLVSNFDQAEKYFSILLEKINLNSNELGADEALTILYYSLFLVNTNGDKSLYYLNLAFEYFYKHRDYRKHDFAELISLIGNFYRTNNNAGEALKYFQKYLFFVSNSFTDNNVLSNPALSTLTPDFHTATVLLTKAFCLKECYKTNNDIQYLKSAYETFLLGFDIGNELWSNVKSAESKYSLQKEFRWAQPFAIQTCLELYERTENKTWLARAFEVSERGKAMVLQSELRELHAKRSIMIPEEKLTLEIELKRNIFMYRNNIWKEEQANKPNDSKLSFLQFKLLALEKSFDSLNQVLEEKYPEYSKLKSSPQIISLEDLQDVIENDEVIIEYTLTEDRLFTFVISNDNIEVNETELVKPLAKDIFELKENLDFNNVPEYDFEDYMQFQISAYALYSILIQPIEDHLKEKSVIIIPDNELNYLSFEALIENLVPSNQISFRKLPYLLNKYPFSYAPSSTVLALLKKGKKPELNSGVLAMAPSTSMITRSFLENNKELAKVLGAPLELPGIEWEANKIMEFMKGKKLIGEEATESEFKRLASSYDILHFATHTWIDDNNPLSSTLAFYPYGDKNEDGVLHTYEIFNLSLKGELAFLSACSTGDGKLMQGEGVISLARAFAAAGIPSVIMTLWDVEDISTGNIVPIFYRLLKEGVEKDAALRMAKLKYLEKTKPEIETHPAFWSGFVLYGNHRGFKTHSDRIYKVSLVFLLGIFATFAIIILNKYLKYRKINKIDDIDLSGKLQHKDGV